MLYGMLHTTREQTDAHACDQQWCFACGGLTNVGQAPQQQGAQCVQAVHAGCGSWRRAVYGSFALRREPASQFWLLAKREAPVHASCVVWLWQVMTFVVMDWLMVVGSV
jgi:hypothetical protein